MSISIDVVEGSNTATIKVNGRFDFSVHNEFRKSYKDVNISNGVYNVDLSETDYMDSSALGMLLLLKEHADSNSSRVKLVKANNDIKEILHIASFDKLFTVE